MKDKDFLNDDESIKNKEWKDYWKDKEHDPSARREVRKEKSATKKRLHRKARRNVKQMLDEFEANGDAKTN